jgi:hypothetical protein
MTPGWFWTALLAVTIAAAALALYRRHFPEPRHERPFLGSVAFFTTFVAARGMAYAVAAGIGPFRNVRVGSVHVHHLVWGILISTASPPRSPSMSSRSGCTSPTSTGHPRDASACRSRCCSAACCPCSRAAAGSSPPWRRESLLLLRRRGV